MNTSKIKARFAKAVNRLERAWDENPLAVIGAAAAVLGATARIVAAVNGIQNRRVWKKEVNRRIRKEQP